MATVTHAGEPGATNVPTPVEGLPREGSELRVA
jgi:hypothetical protein